MRNEWNDVLDDGGIDMGINHARRVPVMWKTPSISADGLKIFACLTMLLSAISITIVEKGMIHMDQYTTAELSGLLAKDSSMMVTAGVGSVMQLAGGLCIPIFAFLLVEGFLHTSNFQKYLLRLLLCALISEVPYDLAVYGHYWDLTGQNPVFAMFISLAMLYFLRLTKEKDGLPARMLQFLFVFCAVIWVSFLRAGYGFCIVLLVAVFYCFYARNVLKTVLGAFISLLYVTGPLAFYGIWCYNGRRDNRIPAMAYYIFYPAHLLVLGITAKYLM